VRKPKPSARGGRETERGRGASPTQSETLLREIGACVRAARIRAALSQEAAADRAAIDYKRWQEIEAGRVNPTARTLWRVAEAVETDFWGMLQKPPRPKRRKRKR
jgi:transcriptional regulator with XRE-family HTH domain